jgi:pyruvate dehydrogenase E2 component (dihydrolipoamide acetyltransferase)
VAVDTEAGLLVPVIRDAHTKDITEIDAELRDLAEASRNRTVSPEQLHGASFSITNLGAHGTTDFTPIIPWPQVAILGVGRAEPKPVFDGKAFVPRTIVPLGITYDHRAADGADAARFLGHIVECLEQPLRLLLSP